MYYNFPTERNLEVLSKSGYWIRVTCDTFRSYHGPRRIDGEPFYDLYYYRDTNFPFTDDCDYKFAELFRSDYVSKVGENHNPVKRRI
jgi:hypothetical protein